MNLPLADTLSPNSIYKKKTPYKIRSYKMKKFIKTSYGKVSFYVAPTETRDTPTETRDTDMDMTPTLRHVNFKNWRT